MNCHCWGEWEEYGGSGREQSGAEPLTDAFRQREMAIAWEGMDIVNTAILLLILALPVLLVLTPPFAVRHALTRKASGRAAWLLAALALIGPLIASYILLVLVWLPAYSGQCGGWLGETSPCSGFGQYALETMYWAAISMAIPGLLGMLLGVAVLIVVLIRRRMSRPAA